MDRRKLLKDGTLFLLGSSAFLRNHPAGAVEEEIQASDQEAVLRLGLITDVHYADKAAAGTRHYRDSLSKMEKAVALFREQSIGTLIELGDFVDAAETPATEVAYLESIEKVFSLHCEDRHYVLGNHCVWTLTKQQFADHCGARSQSYYSFDRNGVHLVVLDACFRADGVSYGNRNYEWTDTEIPPVEREWLEEDLRETDLPTLVFVHQRLDTEGHYAVKSAPQVRDILQGSGKVLAVFQGHNHVNDHRLIGDIHYCTLAAAIEGPGPDNNAFGILEVLPGGHLRIKGFHNQESHELPQTRG
jgi:alkaline phosphatase